MVDVSHSDQSSGPDDSPALSATSTMITTPNSPIALSCHTNETKSSKPCQTSPLLRLANLIKTSKLAGITENAAVKGYQLSGRLRCLIGRHGGRMVQASRIMAAMGGFIVACIALWSAICAMEDSRKAVRLAEWTAKKDFLEFCQTAEYQETGCEKTKTKSLGPPPTAWIKARMYRREKVERLESFQGLIVVFLAFPLAAILWAMFRQRLKRVIGRQLRFKISGRPQKPRQPTMRRDRVVPPITFSSGMDTAFNFDSPLPQGKPNFGTTTGLERISKTEAARRKRKRRIPSSAELAPIILNLSQSRQRRYLHYCSVCSLEFTSIEELDDHTKTHIPVYCWQCDLKGINRDGKTVVRTPRSVSCLANPVFCHYCGDSFARWSKEDMESEVVETIRLRKSKTRRSIESFAELGLLEREAKDFGEAGDNVVLSKSHSLILGRETESNMNIILARTGRSMPQRNRRSSFLEIVME